MKTIAFIPARGGSKSIPLKNIKLFNGQPLIYWTLKELQHTNNVDQVIVSTDSKAIKSTVLKFDFSKVDIHDRSAANAQDGSTTESVMLEFIEQSELEDRDVFMLVQVTAPLTTRQHFSEGLNQFQADTADSLLSVVPSKRFFWSAEGAPINYDYNERPRRQDFPGMLMENGAFYISTIAAISKSKNRLSGKIIMYMMPEYTAYEIDEPADWLILEQLHKHHNL